MRLPPDFEREAFDLVMARVPPRGDPPCPEWRGCMSSMNGVASRFRSAADADDRFTESITRAPHPGTEERQVQEEALFLFFTSAVSAFDCLYMAIYYVAALRDPVTFSILPDDLRRVSPDRVHDSLKRKWPTDPIILALHDGLASRRRFTGQRDALAHRGCLPRHEVASDPSGPEVPATTIDNPKDTPAAWQSSLLLTPATTRDYRVLLGSGIAALLLEMRRWVST